MQNFTPLFENHLKIFLPEIYLITITLFILVVGVTISNLKKYKYVTYIKETTILTILTLFFTVGLLLNNGFVNVVIFNNLFIVDDFSVFIKSFALLATLGCLVSCVKFVEKSKVDFFEYLILILFSTFGLLCLVSSFDLVSMYISLELQSLCFYILASMKRNSAFSTEAGLKYFILGAFSSGILLLGISFIYGVIGSTNFENVGKFFLGFNFFSESYRIFDIDNRLIAGIICIFVGVLFKLTAAPFHMWAPDVYEGSPFFITVLFSVVPKIGMFAIGVKIFYFALYEGLFYWQSIGLYCVLFSVSLGTFKALFQNKIKRFLAYSSITHVGFLLVGFSTGTVLGVQSLLFYIVVYTIMILNIWAIFISLELKNNKEYKQIRYINDLQGLYKSNPLLAGALAINMFSMAGIPPLAGFFAKFYILFSGLESSFNLIVIVSILFSVISAFYYIRFIKIIFFDDNNSGLTYNFSIDLGLSLVIGITFFFIIFLFLSPNLLTLLTQYLGWSIFIF